LYHYSPGFLSALFFAILSINTQPVTYLISRANIVAVLFFMFGFGGSLYVMNRTKYFQRSPRGKIIPFIIINLLLYGSVFLGLGGKEIVITLPFVFIVFVFLVCSKQKESKKYFDAFCFFIPFVLGIHAYLLFLYLSTGSVLPIPDMKARSPLVNIMTQFCVIHLYYIIKILFPINLFLDPVFPEIKSIFNLHIFGAFLVFCTILTLTARYGKKHPIVIFGLLWFYITIAPTSSLIPLWDIVAERRVYLPSIGLAFVFESVFSAYFLKTNVRNKKMATYLLVGLLCYFSFFTLMRNYQYTSSINLLKRELKHYPDNPRIFSGIIYAYIQKGKTEEAKQFFLQYDLNKLNFDIKVNKLSHIIMIVDFMLANRISLDRALTISENMTRKYPNKVEFLNSLQTAYLLTGQNEKTTNVIDTILQTHPHHLIALLHKAYLLSLVNSHEEAIRVIRAC
jgi:protein O-mannosyl-transferase